MSQIAVVHARRALLPSGWADSVRLKIATGGLISSLTTGVPRGDGDLVLDRHVLLPAPANVHSHAFQRAIAGMTEHRTGRSDDFWTWRRLMYEFLERLTPEHLEAVAAMVQIEMLEAGFAACCEFHYLHHAPHGRQYRNPAEMSERIVAAAGATGIGLTLLPVLYTRGGTDNRALEGGQLRFGNTIATFAQLVEAVAPAMSTLPHDCRLGVAPHSLRAVSPDDLADIARLRPGDPLHIHVAEQTAEVEEIRHAYGARPVEWLLDHSPVGERWCLIHATHMTPTETAAMAATGCVAGLCPITEANLGDGVFNGQDYLAASGKIAVGSDSNVLISLVDELRMLEYGQRLARRKRAVLVDAKRSVGRTLLEEVARGGALSSGRDAGRIEEGALADLVAIDIDHPSFDRLADDVLLDAWIFACPSPRVAHVWSAGRHVVAGGRHRRHDEIRRRFWAAVADLRA